MQPQIDYQTLAGALLAQFTGKREKTVPSSTPTTFYGHGPGGLFSGAGLSQQMFSAMVLPGLGLQSMLPARPSRDANPQYGLLTGVTASSGSEPTGVCDDPPSSGLAKLCTHSFVFGRQSRQSRVFELDRMGLLTNRGEFTDFVLAGDPFNNQLSGAAVPTMPGMNMQQVARNEMAKAIFEMGVGWSRDFAQELYTGNPTNNTAQGGRKYFYGLDVLINTGYRDAVTGQACPAADSTVRSFGGLNVADNGATLVRTMSNIYRNLRFLASKAGLEPASWVLAMPWSLFYEITEVWPCAYHSYRCIVSTGSTNMIMSASDQLKLRDDMRGDIFNRTGQYLMIDGQMVPVVIDDAIAETDNGGGGFTSSIYFVPIKVVGNTLVTFFEYMPYDVPGGAMDAAAYFAPPGTYYVSDGGRFLWHRKPPTNFCVQLLAKTEPRLLLLTPYLAARLTNLFYVPVQHERSGFTDSSYFADGGRTDYLGYGPSFYSPTS